jgi:hypothetical protein
MEENKLATQIENPIQEAFLTLKEAVKELGIIATTQKKYSELLEKEIKELKKRVEKLENGKE